MPNKNGMAGKILTNNFVPRMASDAWPETLLAS